MSVEVTLGTPLADRLAGVIKPRLVEVGWSTGDDGDSTLSEYIILMLGAGKTQDQIAADLSGDLLNLGPDDPGALEFAKWLFDQVRVLSTQTADSQNPPSDQPPSEQIHSAVQHVEVEMEDANLQQKMYERSILSQRENQLLTCLIVQLDQRSCRRREING